MSKILSLNITYLLRLALFLFCFFSACYQVNPVSIVISFYNVFLQRA